MVLHVKTRDEFIEKFRFYLGGMAMYGYVSEERDGPMERAKKWRTITDSTDKLLGQMFDWITEVPPNTRTPAPQKVEQKRLV